MAFAARLRRPGWADQSYGSLDVPGVGEGSGQVRCLEQAAGAPKDGRICFLLFYDLLCWYDAGSCGHGWLCPNPVGWCWERQDGHRLACPLVLRTRIWPHLQLLQERASSPHGRGMRATQAGATGLPQQRSWPTGISSTSHLHMHGLLRAQCS